MYTFYMYYFIQSSLQPYEVSTIIVPILQIRKLKLRKVNQFDQNHIAIKQQNPDFYPALLGSKVQALKSHINCFSIDCNIENKSTVVRRLSIRE